MYQTKSRTTKLKYLKCHMCLSYSFIFKSRKHEYICNVSQIMLVGPVSSIKLPKDMEKNTLCLTCRDKSEELLWTNVI